MSCRVVYILVSCRCDVQVGNVAEVAVMEIGSGMDATATTGSTGTVASMRDAALRGDVEKVMALLRCLESPDTLSVEHSSKDSRSHGHLPNICRGAMKVGFTVNSPGKLHLHVLRVPGVHRRTIAVTSSF
jgi:hypothetical protein